MLKAVLFDWSGTLVEFEWDDELFAEGHRAGLVAVGSGLEPSDFTARYRETVLPRVGTDYGLLLRELLGELGDEQIAAFIDAEHRVWRGAHRVLASAQALLESLRTRELATGLVANSWPEPGRVLRRDVEDDGLADLLDVIVCSDEVGARKPDPRIFEWALEKLALEPEQVMYVGDSLEKDVQGAANLGMTTVQAVWFEADDSPGTIEPDFLAFTPMDVLNAVNRLA